MISTRPPPTTRRDRPTAGPVGVGGLIADIGLPLIAYYALHLAGVSDWAALLAAGAAAGLRLGWVAVRTRRLTWFASMMLAVFLVGLALALAGRDPRWLLLKDSAGTATIGAVFLLSALTGTRPLTLSAAQTWSPRRAAELEELHRTQPAARRVFRVSALGWGIGLLTESVLRIPLVAVLPVAWGVGVSTAWMVTAMAGLLAWNAAYVSAAARRAPALAPLLPGGGRSRGR